MSESTRPKRVVIVDADNPLQEVHGEFFWREDHERLLASARTEAFERGYAEGVRNPGRAPNGQVIVRVRRSRSLFRMALLAVVLLVVAGYLFSLVNA
jgi:hypothetical protein